MLPKVSFHTTLEPVSRADLGNGNYALYTGDALAVDRLSAFGETLTAQLSPRCAWRFDYGTVPNTRLYNTTGTANGGTVAISQSRAQLDTTTAVNGIARVSTNRRLRYLPGMGGLVRFTAVFDTPKANSSQIIGSGDTQDGFFFGYQGTIFGTFVRRGGSDAFTAFADWENQLGITPQLGNVYQIRYQWLGFGFIRFYILHPTTPSLGWVLVHSVLYPNTTQVTSILNPTLPLMAEVANTGNNTNLRMYTPSAVGFLEGVTGDPFNPLNVFNSYDASATFADTNNNHMLTIRNKSTFGGIANRLPIDVHNLNIGRSAAGSSLSNVRLYRNATFAGALTYADIDTNNSPVEVSTTTTTITSTNAEHAFLVTDAVTLQSFDWRDNELVLQPGETLTIGIQNGGVQSTDFVVDLNWTERF